MPPVDSCQHWRRLWTTSGGGSHRQWWVASYNGRPQDDTRAKSSAGDTESAPAAQSAYCISLSSQVSIDQETDHCHRDKLVKKDPEIFCYFLLFRFVCAKCLSQQRQSRKIKGKPCCFCIVNSFYIFAAFVYICPVYHASMCNVQFSWLSSLLFYSAVHC